MFTSKPPTCAGRTLALPRKDRDIRYLRPLGNSDIAPKFSVASTVGFSLKGSTPRSATPLARGAARAATSSKPRSSGSPAARRRTTNASLLPICARRDTHPRAAGPDLRRAAQHALIDRAADECDAGNRLHPLSLQPSVHDGDGPVDEPHKARRQSTRRHLWRVTESCTSSARPVRPSCLRRGASSTSCSGTSWASGWSRRRRSRMAGSASGPTNLWLTNPWVR